MVFLQTEVRPLLFHPLFIWSEFLPLGNDWKAFSEQHSFFFSPIFHSPHCSTATLCCLLSSCSQKSVSFKDTKDFKISTSRSFNHSFVAQYSKNIPFFFFFCKHYFQASGSFLSFFPSFFTLRRRYPQLCLVLSVDSLE